MSVFLLFPLHGQAIDLSPQDIQKIKQLSPEERNRLAKQFGQQQAGSRGGVPRQSDAGSTDTEDDAAKAVNSREKEKTTTGTVKAEIEQYRNKVSVPTEELEPFGYALFAGESSTFAPTTEIPVPSEYRIGPGDIVRLQLFGQQNELYEMAVNRDGTLHLPRIGPISVAGLDFDEMRRQLSKLIAERFIGVEASITLGELRSIRVFIMGETRNPGAYTVSSLSNITNALFISGGVKVSGSLRSVKLIRSGEVIAVMDLYDLLLRGDTSGDRRLMPGDVIFIPTVGKTAAIGGQVKRPAIYELRDEKTLADLVSLAGGYRAEAYPRFTKLKRINSSFERAVENIDLTLRANQVKALRSGDEVTVGAIDDLRDGFVKISGAVLRPGIHEWKPGLRVSDILAPAKNNLRENADLDYGLIIREVDGGRNIKALAFVVGGALVSPGSESDPELSDRDKLLIFNRASEKRARDTGQFGPELSGRDKPLASEKRSSPKSESDPELNDRNKMLASILDKLDRQVAPGEAPLVVEIGGQVRYPGRYPLTEGMTLSDLVRLSGGLLDSSYLGHAEIARTLLDREQAVTRLLNVNVDLSQAGSGDVPLQARDSILIKQLPAFGERLSVTVEGEVRFPGSYTIQRGEMLSSLLERAGGLTPHAYAKGAVFTRASLRELEAARLREAEERLQKDLAGLSLDQAAQFKAAADETAAEKLEGVLKQVKSSEAMGRMVIDLPAVLAGKTSSDFRLMDGDTLSIPQKMRSVTVVGEVQYATSHLLQSGLSLDDYIERSGGLTRSADEDRVYVIRADGSVWMPKRSRWFSGRGGSLEPGDTVVVPFNIDQINGMELASGLSQIIYQMALGAAAVRSF